MIQSLGMKIHVLAIEEMNQDDLHEEHSHTNEIENNDTENDIEVIDREEQIKESVDDNQIEQEITEQALEAAWYDVDMQYNTDDTVNDSDSGSINNITS